jgi:hypothetical protein
MLEVGDLVIAEFWKYGNLEKEWCIYLGDSKGWSGKTDGEIYVLSVRTSFHFPKNRMVKVC